MAVINYAANTVAAFNALSDTLNFASNSVSAASLQFQSSGADLLVGVNGQFMTLLNTSYPALGAASLRFADGSLFVPGSNGKAPLRLSTVLQPLRQGSPEEVKQASPEVRARAVRLVQDHRGEHPSLWAAIEAVAPKIGCAPQTLLDWVQPTEADAGEWTDLGPSEAKRIQDLAREVADLRRANQILKLDSAPLPQAERDHRPK